MAQSYRVVWHYEKNGARLDQFGTQQAIVSANLLLQNKSGIMQTPDWAGIIAALNSQGYTAPSGAVFAFDSYALLQPGAGNTLVA